MMKKLVNLISAMTMLTGLSLQAATLNEWSFYSDPAGKLLSEAYNSASAVAFDFGDEFDIATDGFGKLLCTHEDTGNTGMWTDGTLIDATLPSSITSGSQYLRYDFSYDLSDTNLLNDSGCVVGFSFYDGGGDRLAGIALQYDVDAVVATNYTELTELTNTTGTVCMIAKIDLSTHILSVWYSLNGNASGFSEASPNDTFVTALSSFDSLRFQATGDIQPAGSSDLVSVDLLRTADAWADITKDDPVVPAAKYLDEWTFERDIPGITLSEAMNTGTNSPLAQFDADYSGDIFTTNRVLLCIGQDAGTTGVWDQGELLNAALTSSTSGVHYLRYDVAYDLSSPSNNSGTVLGVYFTGNGGEKAAGLILGYDVGNLQTAAPTNRTLTSITNDIPLTGTLTAIAEVNLDTHILNVWYNLTGSNVFNTNSPSYSTSITLTNIDNLCFQATGDFRPSGSTANYAAVDNIRHTASWSDIIAPPANLAAAPVLQIAITDSQSGSMEIGETNTVSVVINNSGGTASAVTSTLIHNGAPSAFTIISNNTPVILNSDTSITNTYTLIANTKGKYVLTAQAHSTQTNSSTTNLDLVVGSQISYLTNSISEVSGGVYPGLYEPGETLEITIISTNDGARAVSNIVNSLTTASAGFTITPLSSASYPSLNIGASTSTLYQVVIGSGVTDGTYTFSVTNSSGSNTWSGSLSFDVFIRHPNSDWVKANNTNDLNLPNSWTIGIVPNSTDRAVMNQTVTAPITTALGTDLSWGGIALVSNTAAWTINGSNTLSTGSAGIDMSQAQANLTIASHLALSTTQTWNVATSRTLTVSGTISGTNTAPLVKSGAGTLVITNAANSYSGNILINEGTLSVANTNVLGKGTLAINGSILATADTALLTNAVVLTNSVTINNANALTLSGAISGSGSLTKTGNGQLFLAATNTYSGGTTNYGFIQIGNESSLGSGTLVMMSNSTLYATFPAFTVNGPSIPNPIVLAGNAVFTNILTQVVDMMKLGGNISGPGSLNLGGYRFYLYGSNTFSGGLTLNVNNAVFFDNGNVFGSTTVQTARASALIALSTAPAVVNITNTIVMNNSLRINPLGGRTVVLPGTMSGSGVFQRTDNNNGILEITGNNIGRTGATTYQYGTLRLGHENALGTGALNIAANQNFSLEVLKDLTNGIGVPNNIALTAVVDANGVAAPLVFNLEHNLKLSGAITGLHNGIVTVQKNGSGSLILDGVSPDWDHPISINGGSLEVNGYLGNPLITANSGTKLQGTGWVQAVTMNSGSILDLSTGGMTFNDTLTLESGVITKLSVTNANCALHGTGVNTLSAAGTLRLDFTGNASATNGAVFNVLNNWGTRTDHGLLTLAFGLPSFLKLDTSNLFVNGNVTIVPDTRVSAHAIEITVPQGGTGSGSIILSNSTAGTLSYTAKDDGSWPANQYQVTTQSMTRASFLPAQFDPATTISNWNGNSSPVMNIGFTFPLYGTEYTTFSVNQYGAITFGGATDGANPGGIPKGNNPVIAPFWGYTLISTNSIRYKRDGDHLVVAWNNQNGTNKEFQAWIYADGRIRYLYQYGVTNADAVIGMQNGSFSRNLSSYPAGSTSDGSLLMTPKSWVSSAPDTATLSPGQIQVLTFTADGVGRTVGDYFFTATVRWSDLQTSDIGVFITVTPDTSKLNITPSPLIFSGPAGFITQTNLFVTNSGSAALSYVITDSGLQGAGYNQTNVDYSWFYIPQAANYMLSAAQLGSQSLNIGFPFVFFGNVYTTLTVNANGTLTLGSEQTISPFGAALSLDSNASVRFFADPGLSRFTVTWENIAQSGGGSNQTFQTVLNRDGEILFNYQQLASGWTNGAIQLIDSSGTVSGTLVSASTMVTNITITPIYSNKVTVVGNVTNIVPEKIGATTNIVTSYTATANLKAIRFTPGQPRIISASPTSGTIPGGGSTNIVVTGDARSLTFTTNTPVSVTNSTTLTFTYAGVSTNVGVTFTATNSTESAYPAADAIAQADMWGADPVVNSQQNADGSRTLSWAMANDGLSRTYVVWYSVNLMSGWTELYRGDNFNSYTDSQHKDVPVIYYKVSVQ